MGLFLVGLIALVVGIFRARRSEKDSKKRKRSRTLAWIGGVAALLSMFTTQDFQEGLADMEAEQEVHRATAYEVSFSGLPHNTKVSIFGGGESEPLLEGVFDRHATPPLALALEPGRYRYEANASDNYIDKKGSFNVNGDTTVEVVLEPELGPYTAGDVIVNCQELIKEQLLSPRNAKFPGVFSDRDEPRRFPQNNSWTWTTFVDADNAFGVPIRMDWSCYVDDSGYMEVGPIE